MADDTLIPTLNNAFSELQLDWSSKSLVEHFWQFSIKNNKSLKQNKTKQMKYELNKHKLP